MAYLMNVVFVISLILLVREKERESERRIQRERERERESERRIQREREREREMYEAFVRPCVSDAVAFHMLL